MIGASPQRWIGGNVSGDRARVLRTALAEVGTREATGKNDGPAEKYMPKWAHGKGLPWCAFFVGWVWQQATGQWLYGRHWGGAYDIFTKGSRDATETPGPGDIFVIDHDGDLAERGPGHVGFITRVSKDGGQVNTVEGNLHNGVRVATRAVSQFAAVISPYGDKPPAPQGILLAPWVGDGATR